MSERAEEKAMDAWAIYEYREHPKVFTTPVSWTGIKKAMNRPRKMSGIESESISPSAIQLIMLP